MIRQLADEPWAPVAQGHPGAEVVRCVRVALRARTKSAARYERKDHPGPRSARPTGSQGSRANGRLRCKVGMVEMIRQLADEPWAPVAQGHPGAEVVR